MCGEYVRMDTLYTVQGRPIGIIRREPIIVFALLLSRIALQSIDIGQMLEQGIGALEVKTYITIRLDKRLLKEHVLLILGEFENNSQEPPCLWPVSC